MLLKKMTAIFFIILMLLTFFLFSCSQKKNSSENNNINEGLYGDERVEKNDIASSTDSSFSDLLQADNERESDDFPVVLSIYSEDKTRANIIMIEESGNRVSDDSRYDLKIITEGIGSSLSPELLPDKSRIVFYSDTDGDYDIYVKDINSPDSSNLTNLTDNKSNDYLPGWSADGSEICYQSDEAGNSDIYIISSDGKVKTKATKDNHENYCPVWSYSGDKLFYVSDRDKYFDIYQYNIRDGSTNKLTDDEIYEEKLSLSPDGNKIAYAAGQIGSTVFEIYVLDLKSGQINPVTSLQGYSSNPLWIPCDGRMKIVFESDADGNNDLYIADDDGSNLKNLTDNEYENRICKTSPVGPYIFLQTYGDFGNCLFWAIDLTTMKKENILGDRKSFERLREEVTDVSEIFDFINSNMLVAGRDYADELVDFAMEFGESELLPFSEKYYENDIQQKLMEATENNTEPDLEELADSEYEEIAQLACETIKRKYRLINPEGSIYPIMDYSGYKKYSLYLSEEMNDYIKIMSAETSQPSIMDSGIIIPLEDFTERIISYYEFEKKYPGFARIYKIVNALNSSLGVYMGGIDNTPVFDSNGKIIPERLDDFRDNALKYDNTEFGEKLLEYLELLKSENYTRTEKINEYIENLVFY